MDGKVGSKICILKSNNMKSDKNKTEDRRKFLKTIIKTGAILSLAPMVDACTKGGLSPFVPYSIFADRCNGCGECVDVCKYEAIILPQKTQYMIDNMVCIDCGDCAELCSVSAIKINYRSYYIDKDKCDECGKCEPICPKAAISISNPIYKIKEEVCIGCGDCIEACKLEANCITYERTDYTVRSKCKNKVCNTECISACTEGAITRVNGLAVIDMSKCTRCGKCVPACPHDAINPAKVQLDELNCTHCGSCYKACTHDAIEKIEDAEYHEPVIDENICDGCGECLAICPVEAISYKHKDDNSPASYIDQELCTSCSDCFDKCPHEIEGITRKLEKAWIDPDECRICGDCDDKCRFDAIDRG
jgi:energy-converting hydrogenase B subunit K